MQAYNRSQIRTYAIRLGSRYISAVPLVLGLLATARSALVLFVGQVRCFL